MEQILEHADEKAPSFVVFCDNESATYAASSAATSIRAAPGKTFTFLS